MIAMLGLEQNVITRKMQTLSGGEIVKILLCKMLLGKYNVLIMDEPNNYLDIQSIEALEILMKQYKGTSEQGGLSGQFVLCVPAGV